MCFLTRAVGIFFPFGTPPLTPVQHIYSMTVQHILCETKGKKADFTELNPETISAKENDFVLGTPHELKTP